MSMSRFAELLENSDNIIKKMRLSALDEYQKMPMPREREEEWRYTDISRLNTDSLSIRKADLNLSVCAEGVIFTDMKTALQKHRKIVMQNIFSSFNKEDKFTLHNKAFWENGFFVYVPKNVNAGVLRVSSGSSVNYNMIVLEDCAELKIIEELSGGSGINNSMLEIFAGKNAKANYFFFQNFAEDVYDFSAKRAICDADSFISWNFFLLGGKFSRTKIENIFSGRGASAENTGIFLGKGEQHIDVTTNVFHNVPNTTNNVLVKGVVTEKSSSVYRGLIKIEKGAQKTSSYLSNKILKLSEHSVANSVPSLQIDANDVKASHGATIGQIDESQILYLMSRGLPRQQAEKLIIEGFFEAVLDKVPELKEKVAVVLDEYSKNS